ncbi:hypothetical protein DYB34_012182, partial [Aphanomyces astaci]
DKAFMEPVDGRTNINVLMDGSIASTTTAWATASSSSSSTASSPSSSSSSTASSSFSSSTAPCAASSMVKRPKQPTSMPQTSSDQQSKEQRVVYDARKEDAWFRKWLNFTLLGAHYPEIIQDETSVSPDRYVQLRQLAVTRWDSKVRAAAVATYHNPQTDDILFRLQTEITACRLTIPADRPLHVDVGLQQALMDLFNSYHPLWLTLAFEVVLGIRLVESLTDVLRPSSSKLPRFLKRTILERIVQDPAFNLKTRSPTTLAQLKATTLLRCLMVVYFLDQAHVRRHVDHVALPTLFRPASRIKGSKQVLIGLCQQFLAHERNALRRLHQLQFDVQYHQTVLEEMDMQVVNLAADLRDGVRLARLVETLDPSVKGVLSSQLRFPAMSRLQKMHNVQVTLNCLQTKYHVESSGVTRLATGLSAKHIVDGYREKTLALLSQLISYFTLPHVVHVAQVEMEISRIQQRRRRGGVWANAAGNNSDNDVIKSDADVIHPLEIDKLKEPIAWHLLEWCRVVCATYHVPIRNFTASFADGKALCLMVHYYHPQLLEKGEIQWMTSDTTTERMVTKTPLLANERANFALVNHKVKQLGQVPVLLPLFDSEHLPEEKCILTFLAYLHSRLLGASREIHAAFCLQRWWVQRSRLKQQDALETQQNDAAMAIQRWTRRGLQMWRCRQTWTQLAFQLTLALREESAENVQDEGIPLRCHLKQALAILETSPRVHQVLQAVKTLEICVRVSKECRVECLAHRVPRLLYKTIRKYNRSRRHSELLHQLLQVCLYLTSSRGEATTTMSTPVAADGQDVDGVAESLELWIDMLHMHRESTDLFTLSARLCKRTLATLNANKWSIDKALWRLRLLHAMMAKTAKTQWIVARVAPMTHYTKDHLHPQKAASILHALLDVVCMIS